MEMGLLRSFVSSPDLEVESVDSDGSTAYICSFEDHDIELEYDHESHDVVVRSDALDLTPDAHSSTVDSRLHDLGVLLHKKKYREVDTDSVHVDLFEGSAVKVRDSEDRVKTVIPPL